MRACTRTKEAREESRSQTTRVHNMGHALAVLSVMERFERV